MSTHKPQFAVDAMLGNLARRLRLLGYDSKYDSKVEDAELIKIGQKQRRIIVTKDEVLSKGAEKEGVMAVLIRGNDEIEQIAQVAAKVGLSNFSIDTGSSRCVDCNGKISPIEKIRIRDKVPPGIYDRQEKFWVCNDCKKLYWEGTHFEKLQEFAARLNERVK
ncbi:MAG TPA: Mut7-C RNAse domain-containing protein [Candidatus Nitrosotalea sp.]|nr:Mut7-C RNAse domain-containing protein [Candidatus Nitrosotalea sp.]